MKTEATIQGAPVTKQARGHRWYVLGLLTLVFSFSHMDRNIIAILLPEIQKDLGLTFAQSGAISALAFGATYITLSIPIARLADRFNRKAIIAVCLTIWSGMTAICGTASSFWQMFFARMGVGIGEAGCVPPSQSIIADYFPKGLRASAFAIFGLGIPIGTMLGYFLGGQISDAYSWRYALLAVGLPGLLLAGVLWLTMREPVRGFSDELKVSSSDTPPSFIPFVRFLGSRPSLIQMTIASSLIVFGGYGSQTWIPTFFVNSHGLSLGQISVWLGPTFVLGGLGAVLLSGLADKLGIRDERWFMWIPAIAILLALPVTSIILLLPATEYSFIGATVPSWGIAILLLAIPGAAYSCYIGPVNTMLQQMVGLRMRATTVAVFVLITNLVGLGLGPFLIGVVTDFFVARFGDEALRFAMLTFMFIYVWAAIHFFLAARHIRQDLEALRP